MPSFVLLRRFSGSCVLAAAICLGSLAGRLAAAPAAAFSLRSDDFKDGARLPDAQVYKGMGFEGGNVSPRLEWSGEPAGTKSFVVTVFDPDAPTGSGWWHWVVTDIPASVHELAEGAGSGGAPLPEGAVQVRNDFGKAAYGGAAPPAGPPHRYVFTVYALKVDSLELPPDATAAMVGFMVHADALGSATLTAIYGR